MWIDVVVRLGWAKGKVESGRAESCWLGSVG